MPRYSLTRNTRIFAIEISNTASMAAAPISLPT
jgi:hypothetical protein